MEELLKTAIGQAPSLVVLCFLVTLFLKRDRERDAFIQQLHMEHLAARGESRAAIAENTVSNRELANVVVKLVHTLENAKQIVVKPQTRHEAAG